ncbi:MAG: SsrA-binding protein [Candidatus Portnoybacteria bacterium CG11_big_fil_rev_8_21_14_0_20_40_15]|uniref:SsrA-binding protein n=1 Tax=Candidatus Portnoybacteria bacterium CG11_big_fil_rev_8_21_14_0_20_40_15 TaxID=1974817 RepID=A0A2H0KU88_9BACT|nr:MAG: SsrA-binding protein [Candidatus Portnoybacteria bacterium CG11_big_fil_rev_8_21_14_0_20_40_15]
MPELAFNKKTLYDYEVLEKYEAGLVLTGHEVKSAKKGHLSLQGSYVVIRGEEAWLLNSSISPFQPKNAPPDYDPLRTKKLLLHKHEIASLIGKTHQKGLTLVPLRVYTKKAKVKLEFALARGKRKADKREKIIKRETKRDIDRALRQKY